MSDETNVPVRCSATEGVRWKVPLPGVGHGDPVIWGDRILLTSADGQRHELQFEAGEDDGKEA